MRKECLLFCAPTGTGLARFIFANKLTGMNDLASLSKGQLLELLERKEVVLQQQTLKLQSKDDQLATKDDQLATKDDQLQTKDDIIQQLEEQNKDLELAYNKLWRERFAARSERYINDPDQLRLDFGNTDGAADAAAGLADAL